MTDLLPCPFCGGKPTRSPEGTKLARVRCDNDDCFGPSTPLANADDAVLLWNRRTGTPAQPPADDRRATEDMTLAHNVRQATIEECARHLEACGFRYSQGFDIPENLRRLAAQPPAAPVETERKTFTIPPGYEAVRDSEGRATGEVRPRSSAGSVDGGDLIERLRGRALFLRNYGEQKTPELLERAADALTAIGPQEAPEQRNAEAIAALNDFKRHCRTDISRASFDALKRLEVALGASK